MRSFSSSRAHEDHEFMNKLNYLGHDRDDRVTVRSHAKWEFHETRVKPQQESLAPSRRLIQLVNRDAVFVDAKRILGLFPQVAYKLIKAAGVDRARMVTAFVISLFEAEYFTVDKRGQYDPSIPGNQERARNTLMGILYGKKSIYLTYAGPYFFKHYPDLREQLRTQGETASL